MYFCWFNTNNIKTGLKGTELTVSKLVIADPFPDTVREFIFIYYSNNRRKDYTKSRMKVGFLYCCVFWCSVGKCLWLCFGIGVWPRLHGVKCFTDGSCRLL